MTDNNLGICISCFKDLNFISSPYCNICGVPFEFVMQGRLVCGKCIVKPPYYDIARSIFKFDTKCKKLIHGFKYNDKTASARIFANIIIANYKNDIDDIDFIVPIPMNRIKRIFRQYNPPQILAQELSKLLSVEMIPDLLIKTKWTKPQTMLSRVQREQNLACTIIYNVKRNIQGKNILLVDDVKTTGTTSNHCAYILKKYGAKKVILITIGAT